MLPRHSKSMTINGTLPFYHLGDFPGDRLIEISYSDTFIRHFCKKNKEKGKMYGANLFDVHISKERSVQDEWLLDNEIDCMNSRGVLSVITGMGADLMIIDARLRTVKKLIVRHHLFLSMRVSHEQVNGSTRKDSNHYMGFI